MAGFRDILGEGGGIERALFWVLLALLAFGCLLVVRPFLSPILWALILCFSTWPLFERVEAALGGRTRLAAFIMTLGLATAFVLPLVLLGTSIAGNVEDVLDRFKAGGGDIAAPPGWLASLPLVGATLDAYWRLLVTNTGAFVQEVGGFLAPVLATLRDLLLKAGVGVGRGLLELLLAVLIAFFGYRDGRRWQAILHRMSERVVGPRARQLIEVAAGTIRGVVYGVVGTAAVQAMLATFGFYVAGVPAPFLLGCVVFVLALFPVGGAPLVWAPATLWLFYQGSVASGIFLGAWGFLAVSGIDNFLKPWLISKGSDLSFLPVFFGVLGGVLAFGVLGIFLGPTLLAVGLALVREWMATRPELTGGRAALPGEGPPQA
ncbi:MAG: AI-2E family transporter [Geminicoccaceae bacterium]|nr:AI-2E family transporter [Geminicoccaceae bacterium]